MTKSILGISITSFEAQPCADIISAKSLHEASQTAAYLQVGTASQVCSSKLSFVYIRIIVERGTGNLSVFSPFVTVCIDNIRTPESVRRRGRGERDLKQTCGNAL